MCINITYSVLLGIDVGEKRDCSDRGIDSAEGGDTFFGLNDGRKDDVVEGFSE